METGLLNRQPNPTPTRVTRAIRNLPRLTPFAMNIADSSPAPASPVAVPHRSPGGRWSLFRRTASTLALGACLLLPLELFAASSGEDILVAGTTSYDATGRPWAYLTWQTDPSRLRALTLAVYVKAGDAGSAAPYQRDAIVRLQTDPIVLQPLLQRAVHLGQDLTALDQSIDSLFEKLVPDGSLSLAQKLSAVIRGSLDHPDHFRNLLLLARLHPAAALCLGWAYAAPIPGPAGMPSTFELRAYDTARDRDLAVVGRITVRAGQPVVLPAPGRPVEVPDLTPRGDLNARFRWATPDELRRQSMLQHGFNIYRVPAAFAQQNHWHLAPPSTPTLLAAVRDHPLVHRLNRVPLLNPRDLTAAEAEDLAADPVTFFFSDWNDRFNPNTTRPQADFVNGAQFYYFLTARDLLGRDGQVSPGTLATICDRMPPTAPRRVRVVNHYAYDSVADQQDQRLQVIWNQNDNTPSNTTVAYFVYRWSNLPEMHQHAGDPAYNLVAGPIPHLTGSPTNSYLDNGPGAPTPGTAAGATFWYTVVALDDGACAPGGNRSPHSAPAFGVLRDRAGPAAGGGQVEITCTTPQVTFDHTGDVLPAAGLDPAARHYQLTANRSRPAILWAEFHYDIPGPVPDRTYIGRQYFAPGQSGVTLEFALPRGDLPPAASPRIHCRVGSVHGKVSDFAISSTVGFAPDGSALPVIFVASNHVARTTAGGGCVIHDPHGTDDDTVDEICLTAQLTPGTREVKFYRRVENGPLTLVCQREADADAGLAQAKCCDGAMPAQASDICYYVQLFDEHGNAGPLTRLQCIKTAPHAPLPMPILSPITSIGTSTNARMRLQWFCPPYGVERFEVWMAGHPLAPGQQISTDLTLTNGIEVPLPIPGMGPGPAQPLFQTYVSRRIGPGFGQGSVFTTEADVVVGNHHAVFVRAVGKDGSTGPASNVETFRWMPSPAGGTNHVPWPARPLPAVTATNFPGLFARMFHTNDPVFNAFPQQRFEGVGIRIGTVTMTAYPPALTNAIPGTADPLDHIYRSARDQELLFPIALYRMQAANATFPEVSGDVLQVTPLMEDIAYQRGTTSNGAPAVLIHDPFVRLVPVEPSPGAMHWELYLLDTQPVIEDATYAYVVVRLDPETREIAEMTSTNPVLVTP